MRIRFQKWMSLILVIALMSGYLPQTVFAESSDIIEISSQQELQNMENGNYRLTKDIKLDPSWKAISEFEGTLDGNGKTIRFDGESIFGYILESATVKNLVVKGRATGNSGSLVTRLGGLAEVVEGKVLNTFVEVELVNTKEYSSIGGITGYLNGGTIDSCIAVVEFEGGEGSSIAEESEEEEIEGEEPSYGDYLGGLIGEVETGKIKNSYWTSLEQGAYVYDDTIFENARKIEVDDLKLESFRGEMNANLPEDCLTWDFDTQGKLVPGGEKQDQEQTVKEKLKKLVEEMKAVDTSLYEEEGATVFRQKLQEAENLLDASSSDEEMKEAMESLAESFAQLKKIPVNKEELKKLVDENSNKDFSLYTGDSFSKLEKVLEQAKKILDSEDADQSSVNKTADELKEVLSNLKERNTEGFNLETYEGEIVEVGDSEQLKQIQDGKIYRLTKDISIGSGWLNLSEMNAVFDGNGYSITFLENVYYPLFAVIGEDGIVQNLGVKGKLETIAEGGAIAGVNKGLIINSYSHANIKASIAAAGGLAGRLEGGSVINSYVAGEVQSAVAGGLVGQSKYGLIENSFWNEKVAKASGKDEGFLNRNSRKVSPDWMKSKDFVDELNTNRRFLKSWGREKETGFPHHGEDHEFVPEEGTFRYPVKFTDLLGNSVTLEKKGAIKVNSILGDRDFVVGKVELLNSPIQKEKIRWTTTDEHSGNIKTGLEDGVVYCYGEGRTTVQVYEVDSSGSRKEKIAEFDLVSEVPNIQDLQVFVVDKAEVPDLEDAENVAKQKFVIEGRQYKEIILKAKLEGSDEFIDVNEYNFNYSYESKNEQDKKKFSHNRSEFIFNAPHSTRFSISAGEFNTYVDLESSYVPVKSIRPIGGKFVVHARNSMSQNFDFMPLTGSGTLVGTDANQSVIVEPKNASFGRDWELESSDKSIVNYVPYIIVALVPYQAGKVELTAISKDPYLNEEVKGTSVVEIVYKNPIRSIELQEKKFKLKEEETVPLNMVLRGSDPTEEHVSEPKMEWRYEGNGKVEIATKRKYIDQGLNKPYVADDVYYIKGIAEGHVKVVGIPYDRTNHLNPVTFEIEVVSNTELPQIDVDKKAREARGGAKFYFLQKFFEKDYLFGDEWAVFTLSRMGVKLEESAKKKYVESVMNAYSTSNESYLSNRKPTTIARTIIALTSLGMDVQTLEGHNFVETLLNLEEVETGSNESIFALIAIDTKPYSDSGYRWDREKLIDEILKYQNPETGGFGLYDAQGSSVDITSMALQALSRYQGKEKVKSATEKALKYLKDRADSGFGYESVEAIAQTLTALTSLKKDPLKLENGFSADGRRNIVTALLKFYDEEKFGFKHGKDSISVNDISTVQSLYALESYFRLKEGRSSLYDCSDLFGSQIGEEKPQGDKETLKQLILKLDSEKLEAQDYTEQSYLEFQRQYQTAKDILLKENASQEEVDQVLVDLQNARQKLQKKPEKIDSPSHQSKNEITVTFSLKGMQYQGTQEEIWIPKESVTVPEGSNVYKALETALNRHNISFTNKGNYISEMKSPITGQWLAEFTNGRYSGWMYQVNGIQPDKGVEEYVLSDGDNILFYYTNDYRNEPGSETWKVENSSESKKENQEGNTKIQTQVKDGIVKSVPNETFKKLLELSIKEVKEQESPVVFLDVRTDKKVKEIQMKLDGESIQKVTEQKQMSLGVKSDLLELVFDKKAMEIIQNSEKKSKDGIKIVISQENNAQSVLSKQEAITEVRKKEVQNILGERPVFDITVKTSEGNVSDYRGGRITVKLPYKLNPGDLKDSLTAYRLEEGGKLVEMKDSSYDAIEGIMSFTTDHLSYYAVGEKKEEAQEQIYFADVEKDKWYREAIHALAKAGVLQGREDNKFYPNEEITRAEFVTLLWKHSKEESKKEMAKGYEDVSSTAWYYPSILWAEEKGIAKGYGKQFKPDGKINREEMAVMIANYAKYSEKIRLSEEATESEFKDLREISKWAKPSIDLMFQNKVIMGKEGGRFAPKEKASRAEAAQMIYSLWMK